MNIKLYNYQEVALKKILPALKKFGKALVVMATGLGKTIVSLFVLKKFVNKSSRVLFLCHQSGILTQTQKKYKSFFGLNYTYAEFFGTKKNWEADKHNFVFATFQSLNSHLFKSDRKNIFSPKHFDYIVVDESHHSKAETFDNVINYFEPKWILGITATPDREDEEDIRKTFGKEVVNYPLALALAKGWLTKVVYKVMTDGINQDVIDALVQEVLVENVRMTESQLNEKLFIRKRTEEQIKDIIDETHSSRKALIFCKNIPHLTHVQEMIPSSVAVYSDQTPDENEEALKAFNSGLAQCMLAVDQFNEGMDVPDIDLLSFLRGTGSYRVWIQQLGRGLRKFPGKEEVVILDFVGNIERMRNLKDLFNRISEFSGSKRNINDELVLNQALHIDGDYFTFDFSAEIVNLFSVLEKIDLPFYETWEEASLVARSLGIKGQIEYTQRYKEDRRLPSRPDDYLDFPGWRVFLGKEKREFYKTWQEASKAAIGLGIKTSIKYKEECKKDSKLPKNPVDFYNLPGWRVFLGKEKREFYKTWQEASKAAIGLGIKTLKEYGQRYKEDPSLRSSPDTYENFPGWPTFFDKTKSEFYKTWQEASKAAIGLGIKTMTEYREKYIKDPLLPKSPHNYQNFPGWPTFLGKTKPYYTTWQEASKAAIDFGFKTIFEYREFYSKDPSLPKTPDNYEGFPGWPTFLGKTKPYYTTWQEASKAAIGLGIKTWTQYNKLYKKDEKLPSSPRLVYSDYPGFKEFLGITPRIICSTWQEASVIAQKLGIKSQPDYKKKRAHNLDSRLPNHPNHYYSDFPGWPKFLGKK